MIASLTKNYNYSFSFARSLKLVSKTHLFIFTEERVPSFRVSEYLKSQGRQTLEDFTKSLEREIKLLKSKQIRERKNTWLYKAEKVRGRNATSMPFELRRSTARVSPSVNSGFVGDSATLVKNEQISNESERSTSPRQSSLSSFHEFRRKKSAQVYPMQDRPSSQSQSSMISPKQSRGNLKDVEESGV